MTIRALMTAGPRDLYFWNKLWFVLVLGLVLTGLAHGAAEWCAWSEAGGSGGPDQEALRVYYRSFFMLWTATLLVIPAYSFYILRRPAGTSSYWLLFWTASFLVYLAHCCWAYLVPFPGTWDEFMRARTPPVPVGPVWHPLPDVILLLWWGLDLLLAWAALSAASPFTSPPVQLERGALHIFAFARFLALTLFAPGSGAVLRILGVFLFLTVVFAIAVRIVTRRLNPDALADRLYSAAFKILNRCGLTWHRLPTWLGVMNLGALRDELRAKNLVGTEDIPVSNPRGRDAPPGEPTANDLRQLNLYGYHNDLRPGKREMGSGSKYDSQPGQWANDRSNPGSRFGRNVPREATYPDEARLLTPSPREVSRALLQRDTLKEAQILNFLAAAWIQFETHDWFFHGEPVTHNPIAIPLASDDNWDPAQKNMIIRRTRPDPTRDYVAEKPGPAGKPPHRRDQWFCPFESASNPTYQPRRAYLEGKVAEGYRPEDVQHIADLLTARADNETLAHAMVQVVNQRFVGTEIPLPVTRAARNTLQKFSEALFPWKYRRARRSRETMLEFCEPRVDQGVPALDVAHNIGEVVQSTAEGLRRLNDNLDKSVEDLFTIHAPTLQVPRIAVKRSRLGGLLWLPTRPGGRMDLASINVLRDRNRGVLRYNLFRKLLHLPPARTFDQLCQDTDLARELHAV